MKLFMCIYLCIYNHRKGLKRVHYNNVYERGSVVIVRGAVIVKFEDSIHCNIVPTQVDKNAR